jgi:hypothetical protein
MKNAVWGQNSLLSDREMQCWDITSNAELNTQAGFLIQTEIRQQVLGQTRYSRRGRDR